MASLKEKLMNIFKKAEECDDELETVEERKERWKSINVIYFTMFMMSLGFSIILTGVWPFLDKLDPTAGKEFMGLVVASNPFAQMLFSPLVGLWANKAGSIRWPMMTTLFLFVLSSAAYATLEVFETNAKYWMLGSRFLVGVSSANIAAARSYLSAATRIDERTWAISIVSLTQVLGFIFGPIIQACLTVLGEEGVEISGKLRFNMFTATGWLNGIVGIMNLILFLPFFFKEHKIAVREVMLKQGKTDEKETWKSIKPDKVACWTLIFAFFVIVFNFVLVETLATSLTMDQFAWSKTQSLRNMGILMGFGAIIAIAVFLFTKKLTQIFLERKLMVWGGFLITGIATALLLPWGSEPPKLALPKNYTLQDIRELSSQFNMTIEQTIANLTEDGEQLLGCPISQDWCEYTNALVVTQLVLAYLCASIGYPLGVALIQTIFSKLLGPRPQGVWMGFLTGSGCLSRVMGPVFVSFVYSWKGPIWTFTITLILMVFTITGLHVFNHRFIPPDLGLPQKLLEVEMQEYVCNGEQGGAMRMKK